jgi:hypothetical protein
MLAECGLAHRWRRDDPSPAPWTKEGKEIIEREGFTCIYPDGYDKDKGGALHNFSNYEHHALVTDFRSY